MCRPPTRDWQWEVIINQGPASWEIRLVCADTGS
jgi:hypothetical protein